MKEIPTIGASQEEIIVREESNSIPLEEVQADEAYDNQEDPNQFVQTSI